MTLPGKCRCPMVWKGVGWRLILPVASMSLVWRTLTATWPMVVVGIFWRRVSSTSALVFVWFVGSFIPRRDILRVPIFPVGRCEMYGAGGSVRRLVCFVMG